jgi:isopenicillin-N epimerase
MYNLRQQFLLDPNIIFLNHGSFGATPRPVFEEYQRWQIELERQPVEFLARDFNHLLLEARKVLGAYLNANADDLVFIPNATHGANIIARSVQLSAGEEVLTTDHEYGACDYAWEFVCQKIGSRYVHQPILLPVQSKEEMIEQFWEGLSRHTKVIYLSHITSPTALRLPVREICRRAKELGIITVVDAAHSPGQIPVDFGALGADIVFGNCHKWMLAPKGAGFLYVRPGIQPMIEPLIVSWGYHAAEEIATGSQFIDYLQWTGTHDPASYLSVPSAIQFQKDYEWDKVRTACHALAVDTEARICELTGLPSLYINDSYFAQMVSAQLPAETDIVALKEYLYDEHRVEVPLMEWNGYKLIRFSIQGYNTAKDVDALIKALSLWDNS